MVRIVLGLLSQFAPVSMNGFHLISVCRVGENVSVVFVSDSDESNILDYLV
jgi:hypothetical protein